MSDPTIRVERDGRVATLIIDNPTARNGLTNEVARVGGEALRELSGNTDVRVFVLRGAGEHFCSGADLRSGAEVIQADREGKRAYLREGMHVLIEAIHDAPQPVLAVIRGACVGFGFDLAMACDLRLSAADAKFGQVFTRIGLHPDGGSSFTLPRLVGLGRAMELMLLAETFDGTQAAEWGLVNRAVPEDELDTLAADWTERLASGPPIAYRHGKRNLLAGAAGGTLREALEREAETQIECLESQDAARGVGAFFQRTKPEFEGN